MAAGHFITERETEAWRVRETRDIPMPGGCALPFTDFRIVSHSFDFIVRYGLFTASELVELALLSAIETGRPFDQAFPNLLAFTHRTILQSRGYR